MNMTTITKIPFAAPAEQSQARELTVDSLSVRDAVIGDGLMMTQDENLISIHAVAQGRAELIGSFTSAGEALAALDELDELDAA
jgi:hypothetical protein